MGDIGSFNPVDRAPAAVTVLRHIFSSARSTVCNILHLSSIINAPHPHRSPPHSGRFLAEEIKMKTALNCALILLLAAGLFACPAPGLAAPASPAAVGDIYSLSLTGLDFQPEDSDLTWSENNGGMFALALVPDRGFYASYHLPDGSTVTGITIFLMDNSAADIELGAYRYDPATTPLVPLAFATTAGASAAIQAIDLTGTPFAIANGTYAYRLRVEFTEAGMSQRVYGARIQYSLPLVPASTDYITLAGADLRVSSSNTAYTSNNGSVYATTLNPSDSFEKRLDLPQGAVIDQVEWFVLDNHAEYMYMALIAHRLVDNTVSKPASATTLGVANSPSIQTYSAATAITVDNAMREYAIAFLPQAADYTLRIAGARVRYTPPAGTGFGPQMKSFSGVHFYPSGSALTYQAFGSAIYALALSGNRGFETSLDLPSGARIQQVVFFYIDESAEDITFSARYYYPAIPTYSTLASDSSFDSSDELRLAVLNDLRPVDGATTVPRLHVECGAAGSANLLVGAAVEFRLPYLFLPVIRN